MPGICYQKSHFLDFYIKKKNNKKPYRFLNPSLHNYDRRCCLVLEFHHADLRFSLGILLNTVLHFHLLNLSGNAFAMSVL